MTPIFKYDGSSDTLALKDVYCQNLASLLERNPNVVVGEADVGLGLWGMDYFKHKAAFGDRFFDVGIQEANLVGVAAGLSLTGKIPYVHTFAPFITRKTYDNVFLSGSYAKLNIRLIGSDPGITAEYNGGTHMSFEGLGIMRNIPEVTIIDVTDGTMLKEVLIKTEKDHGIFYISFARSMKAPTIYGEGSKFQFGKANILKEGTDITLFAAGIMVAEALKAAEILSDKGISARVVDIFTIKPIDVECITRCSAETGAIVTAENHSVINGLGSAVAEVLVHNRPCPMGTVGIKDQFGEVGPLSYLQKRFGLTAEKIVETSLETIKKK